jgi:diguanylate cyclase (GGDEF)-like protein
LNKPTGSARVRVGRKLGDPDWADDDLTARKVNLLVTQAKIGTVSALCICALYGLVLVRTTGWATFGTWYAIVAAGYAGRQIFYPWLIRRFGRSAGVLTAMAWINAITGLSAVSCLPIFSAQLNLRDLSVISAMVMGWTAASISILAVRPRVYLAFVTASSLFGLFAWSSHVDTESFIVLTVGMFFGGALLVSMARIVNRQMKVEFAHKKATTDSLTRLPNREGIRAEGDALLSIGSPPAVLILDLDRFGIINDALGYEFGDAVLVEVGRRLATLPDVKVGRLHASQYCILAPNNTELAPLVNQVQSMFGEPIDVLGESVDVSFTMGIAIATIHGENMLRLIRSAALASRAAQQKKLTCLTFSENMEAARRPDLSLLSTLKDAVRYDQLELFLQPKISLADGSVLSAEALLRWRHPQRGLVPPSEFIPFAEQTGSIRMLTEWVLKRSLAFVAERAACGDPMQISVNISTVDLRDERLATRAQLWAQDCGARPDDIRLEVTESAVMDDPASALAQLTGLRHAGFSLSIDDFGTGHSSLAYLQKMPVQELKIDRAFVSGVAEGTHAEVLLDSICTLAHRMNLSVVAEGVETMGELNLVKKLGCDYAQGWHFAKAMPVGEFLSWRSLRKENSWRN